MPTRTVTAAAVATALLLPVLPGGLAAAKPARFCHLVVGDRAGWTRNEAQERVLPGSTGDLTIRTADVASDTTWFTALIRLESGTSTDPTRPLQGRRYQFGFDVRNSEYGRWWFEMLTGRETTVRLYRVRYTQVAPGYYDGTREVVATGTGSVDAARAEVRMTVPMKAVTKLRKDARLTGLGASIDILWGEAAGNPADRPSDWRGVDFRHAADAKPGVHYPLGGRSCVRPGPRP